MIPLKVQERRIIEILLQNGTLNQRDLSNMLGITRAALLKHIRKLESEKNLIVRTLMAQIGGAKQFKITLNPDRLQEIRSICGKPSGHYTLISGTGKYNPPDIKSANPNSNTTLDPPKSHEEAVIALNELVHLGYKIEKVILFGTPESDLEQTAKLMPENIRSQIKIKRFPFSEYQNPESKLLSEELITIIRQELALGDLIFDLTPLTKPWSIKLLDYAKNFGIHAFYLAQNNTKTRGSAQAEAGAKIIWINLNREILK